MTKFGCFFFSTPSASSSFSFEEANITKKRNESPSVFFYVCRYGQYFSAAQFLMLGSVLQLFTSRTISLFRISTYIFVCSIALCALNVEKKVVFMCKRNVSYFVFTEAFVAALVPLATYW